MRLACVVTAAAAVFANTLPAGAAKGLPVGAPLAPMPRLLNSKSSRMRPRLKCGHEHNNVNIPHGLLTAKVVMGAMIDALNNLTPLVPQRGS